MPFTSRARGAFVVAPLKSMLVAALLVVGAGCPQRVPASSAAPDAGPATPTTKTFGLYLGDVHVADIEEVGQRDGIARTTRLVGADGDTSTLDVDLNEAGFVVGARYRRASKKGGRSLKLTGRRLVDTTTQVALEIPGRTPIVTFESLHRINVSPGTYDIVVLDVASAETGAFRLVVDAENNTLVDAAENVVASAQRVSGLREGPGVFAELPRRQARQRYPVNPPRVRGNAMCLQSPLPLPAMDLEGPGQRAAGEGCVRFDKKTARRDAPQPRHRAPSIFIESESASVRAFAAAHEKGNVIADATALAGAIHKKLDTAGGGGPPSALNTLARWAGDCDDATALLVASLRAQGHAARPVVGYRIVDGAFGPHAWAEVFVPNANAAGAAAPDGEWLMVDALVPGVGRLDAHLRLFTGLGSTLTMGRVLAAWMPALLSATPNVPPNVPPNKATPRTSQAESP